MTEAKVGAESIIRSMVKVRLMICCWSAKRVSDAISVAVEKENSAERGSVEANICYLPDRYSKPVTTAVSRLRVYWNMHTLPWENDSWRVIPSKSYQTLMDGVLTYKHAFEDATANILTNYEDVLKSAQIRLGDLFDARKFPSAAQLGQKYGVYIYRNSINASQDVRIDGLSDAVVADIRKDVAKQYEEQLNMAVIDIIERIREVMKDVVERTTNISDHAKFATMITKLERTYSSLVGLNITADPRIDALLAKVKALSNIDKDTLKEDTSYRSEVTAEAKGILDSLNNFGG